MSKHTPGPWYVEEHERQRWNSPTTPTRGVVTQAEHHGSWTVYLIGEVSYPTSAQGSVGALERLANAHLIAAAPELLADLKDAADTFRKYAEGHLKKGTPEGNAKARANFEKAARYERTIGKSGGRADCSAECAGGAR